MFDDDDDDDDDDDVSSSKLCCVSPLHLGYGRRECKFTEP